MLRDNKARPLLSGLFHVIQYYTCTSTLGTYFTAINESSILFSMVSLSRLSGGKAVTGPGIDGMDLLPDT